VKTLYRSGQVTTALLASLPPWRRRFLRPIEDGGSDGCGLVGDVAHVQRWMCARSVLVARRVARGHELARYVRW
jgi:hypothetical protein